MKKHAPEKCGAVRKHSFRKPEFLNYIGPGLLVTIGFIDPGNWATNV